MNNRTDSNTLAFLDNLLYYATTINTYIPETYATNKRFNEIYHFAISKRTPQMIKKYSNLQINEMVWYLQDIVTEWEEAQ